MSASALVLAVAVLVMPVSARPRLDRLLAKRTSAAWARPLIAAAVGGCATLIVVVPASAAAALGLVGLTVATRRRSALRRRRCAEEADALQDALDVLVAELKVGVHPVAAVGVAAGETRGAVARSLSTVAARAALGADVAAGMRAEATSACSPAHWERLAVCWQLAHDHGLAIATLMQTAQHDLAERARFGSRVEAGLAGARATATILAGLPAVGLLLGQALGADPLRFLLSGGAGGWMLVIGSMLICGGLIWSDSITARVLK